MKRRGSDPRSLSRQVPSREGRTAPPSGRKAQKSYGIDARLQRSAEVPRGAQGRDPTGELVFGFRAALAVCEVRGADVLWIEYADELERELDDLIEWATREGIRCGARSERALTERAGTRNHEGLLVGARPREFSTLASFAERLKAGRGAGIALDRVRNPYNVGAILRSAAFFGVNDVLLGAPAPHPGLPADAVRVAEGGAEHLAFARTTDLAESLKRLRMEGILVVAADTEGPKSRSAFSYSFKRPVVLVVGNEREGLSDRVLSACDASVSIPGAGKMESLNVSIATSILLAELARREA